MSQNPTPGDAVAEQDIQRDIPQELILAAVAINSALSSGALLRTTMYAALKGVSRQAVIKQVAKRVIPSLKVGDQVFIPIIPESRKKVIQAVNLTFPAELQKGAKTQRDTEE